MRRDEPAPSWTELSAMIGALSRPPAPPPPPPAAEEKTLGKIGVGVATACSAALALWIGQGQMSLTTTLSALGPKIDALSKNVDQLKTSVDGITATQNVQATALAKQDLRLTQVEQNQARVLDRLRAVEGGARIASPAPGANGGQ